MLSSLLTHYLWREDSNIEQIFDKITLEIPPDFRQVPRYEVKVGSGYQLGSPYFVETPNPPAQAVVIGVSGKDARLWLGGVFRGLKSNIFCLANPLFVRSPQLAKGEIPKGPWIFGDLTEFDKIINY
jgi:hypothetical protein